MSQISIGKLFAKALKKEGIDAIFTLSGGHIMPILYACRDEGIRVIDVRHECSGAYAAIAYAKITGQARRDRHHRRPWCHQRPDRYGRSR